jgi:hypothetical protein
MAGDRPADQEGQVGGFTCMKRQPSLLLNLPVNEVDTNPMENSLPNQGGRVSLTMAQVCLRHKVIYLNSKQFFLLL